MNNRDLIQKVREFAKIGFAMNIDPDEVESLALEQLYGVELDPGLNPDGFIYRTVKNAALQLYRAEKRRATPVPEFYDNMVGGTTDRSEYHGLIQRVEIHVTQIVDEIADERRRQAATEYYLNGLSTAQIAEAMSLPKGTVGRLLYEARKGLSDDQVADLLAWDDFNRRETQYNNRGHDEGASSELIAMLRREGYLL